MQVLYTFTTYRNYMIWQNDPAESIRLNEHKYSFHHVVEQRSEHFTCLFSGVGTFCLMASLYTCWTLIALTEKTLGP